MILEEVIEKLTLRLLTLERVLKEKGILQEADIVPASAPEYLPPELGERIRTLNDPMTLDRLSAKVKDRAWLIHQLQAKAEALETQLSALESTLKSTLDKINTRLQAIEAKLKK